ncbi:MAG: hypothetical protein RMJ97_02165 [Raineya sp.]|nr:hypothetical protein [Raineya sp.]MDW8295664.1 hypothetical protein [Raineya sp.]
MKKTWFSLVVLAVLFLFTACPYSADFPLDEPKDKVDNALLGKWTEQVSLNADTPPFYVISKLDDKTYNFEKNDYNVNEKKYKQTNYTGHFTRIGNVNFLNLKNPDDNKYYFHRLDLSADKKEFTLFEVTDNIDEKFTNPADMRKFFEKHKDLSFFYNKDEKKYIKK